MTNKSDQFDLETMDGTLKYCKYKGWLDNTNIEMTMEEHKESCSITIKNIKIGDATNMHKFINDYNVNNIDQDILDEMILQQKIKNQLNRNSKLFKQETTVHGKTIVPGDIIKIDNNSDSLYEILKYDIFTRKYLIKDITKPEFSLLNVYLKLVDFYVISPSELRKEIKSFDKNILKKVDVIPYFTREEKERILSRPDVQNRIQSTMLPILYSDTDSDDSYEYQQMYVNDVNVLDENITDLELGQGGKIITYTPDDIEPVPYNTIVDYNDKYFMDGTQSIYSYNEIYTPSYTEPNPYSSYYCFEDYYDFNKTSFTSSSDITSETESLFTDSDIEDDNYYNEDYELDSSDVDILSDNIENTVNDFFSDTAQKTFDYLDLQERKETLLDQLYNIPPTALYNNTVEIYDINNNSKPGILGKSAELRTIDALNIDLDQCNKYTIESQNKNIDSSLIDELDLIISKDISFNTHNNTLFQKRDVTSFGSDILLDDTPIELETYNNIPISPKPIEIDTTDRNKAWEEIQEQIINKQSTTKEYIKTPFNLQNDTFIVDCTNTMFTNQIYTNHQLDDETSEVESLELEEYINTSMNSKENIFENSETKLIIIDRTIAEENKSEYSTITSEKVTVEIADSTSDIVSQNTTITHEDVEVPTLDELVEEIYIPHDEIEKPILEKLVEEVYNLNEETEKPILEELVEEIAAPQEETEEPKIEELVEEIVAPQEEIEKPVRNCNKKELSIKQRDQLTGYILDTQNNKPDTLNSIEKKIIDDAKKSVAKEEDIGCLIM